MSDRRQQIARALRSLAESQAATMELLNRTTSLLYEEFALAPLKYFQRQALPRRTDSAGNGAIRVEKTLLSVTYRGKTCFLGNTLLFKLFSYLASRPNIYFSYDDLRAQVWQHRIVSDSAVRTVVKNLRKALRRAGLDALADAIDGSASRHYALKAPR
jgi:DNA-binding response OmpR family regulator